MRNDGWMVGQSVGREALSVGGAAIFVGRGRGRAEGEEEEERAGREKMAEDDAPGQQSGERLFIRLKHKLYLEKENKHCTRNVKTNSKLIFLWKGGTVCLPRRGRTTRRLSFVEFVVSKKASSRRSRCRRSG